MPIRPADMTPLIDLTRSQGTGPVRAPSGRSMSTSCRRATTPARPARTSRPGWRMPAGRSLSRGLADAGPGQPAAGRARARLLSPVRDHCNREELDSAVSDPRGRAVPRRPGDARRAGALPIDAPPSGKRVLVVGAGPSGLSAAYHLARLGHEVEIHDAGPLPGGMMHFGIPAYRLPRDRPDEGDRATSRRWACSIVLNHKVEDVARREGRRAGSTPSSSRSARTSPSTSTSRRAMRRACSTR